MVAQRARLDRLSRSAHVADLLRESILAGDFPPGTRLPEPEIGAALRVSRNTLREAFRILVEERLADHQLNRGVFVRVPTRAEVADLYTCRRVVECAAARAARRADPALAAVRTAVTQARAHAAAADWTAVGTADVAFHRAVVALLASPRLDAFMTTAWNELRLAFHVLDDPEALHRPYLDRNQTVADHLTAGENEAAEKLLITYLDDAEAHLLSRYRSP